MTTSEYAQTLEDPRVPMTLRIGVAGSRRIPEEQRAAIKTALSNLYRNLGKAFEDISATDEAGLLYSTHRGSHRIRFISSLAEGIDRLAVSEELIPFEHELAAVIPFLQEEFRTDFNAENSVVNQQTGTKKEFDTLLERLKADSDLNQPRLIELDGDPQDRESAYLHCSQVHAEHCDLLIAVYDTQANPNLGTGATVAAAKAAGLPVIEMDIHAPDQPRICTSGKYGNESCSHDLSEAHLEAELSRVLLFTDVLLKKDGQPESSTDTSTHQIREAIAERVRVFSTHNNLTPSSESPDFDGAGPVALEREFYSPFSQVFGRFKSALTKGHSSGGTNHSQPEEHNPSQQDSHKSNQTEHCFYSQFLRADRLANYYANIHRSGFLLIYLCGALALVFAAVGLLMKKYHDLVMLLVTGELLLLAVIAWIYFRDKDPFSAPEGWQRRVAQGFHGKWLEYRCLAEFLRPLVFLAPLGRSYSVSRFHNSAEFLGRLNRGVTGAGSSWLNIHTEILVRYAGFGHCRLDAQQLNQTNDFIQQSWLTGQVNYHRSNAHKMHHMAEKLEHFGVWCFGITLFALFTKLGIGLAEDWLHHHHIDLVWVSGIAACSAIIFPVLAAAAVAIANHAEFAISSQRSQTTQAFLQAKLNRLNELKTQSDSKALHDEVDEISRVLMKEVFDWLEIYEVKKSELA